MAFLCSLFVGSSSLGGCVLLRPILLILSAPFVVNRFWMDKHLLAKSSVSESTMSDKSWDIVLQKLTLICRLYD
jgi:hypothetical protein